MRNYPPSQTSSRAARLALCLALALALCLAAAPAYAKDWPRPAGPVGDYAKVIPADWQQKISAASQQLRQKTGVFVVVATLPSLDNESIEEAAARLFRAWGIGKKGVDKGVLILVAVGQRKVRIEVGYGLEGSLTDATSGQIRDKVLVPHLREGRYGQGLYEGLLAIAQVVAAEAKVELEGLPKVKLPIKQESPYGSWALWGAIIFVVLLYIVAKAWRGIMGRGGLGGGGGGGGGLTGFLSGLFLGSLFGGGRRRYDNDSSTFGGRDGGGDDSGGYDGGDSGGGGSSGDY